MGKKRELCGDGDKNVAEHERGTWNLQQRTVEPTVHLDQRVENNAQGRQR